MKATFLVLLLITVKDKDLKPSKIRTVCEQLMDLILKNSFIRNFSVSLFERMLTRISSKSVVILNNSPSW